MIEKALLVLGLMLIPISAMAAPGDLCVENFECTIDRIVDEPLSGGLVVFDIIADDFGTLIVWGPVVMAIWIISKDALLTGIFGIVLSSVFVGLNPTAVSIGTMLFAVVLAIALFTIFPRLKNVA